MFILGRILFVRKLAVFLQRDRDLVQDYDGQNSQFDAVDANVVVDALYRDGFYAGFKLPPHTLEAILDYTQTTEMYAEGKPHLRFRYADKSKIEKSHGTLIHGIYDHKHLSSCDAICKLIHDPKLLTIAAHYLGSRPQHISTRLWWCFNADRSLYEGSISGDAQIYFHYDLNDYRSIKFFFYLTDVTPELGPHCCVLGSHRQRKWNYQISPMIGRSDEAIIRDYGKEKVVAVYGSAGFGFVEDTFCFHRGTPPIEGDRLLLSIQYGLHNFGQWS
jgi:hypothetical protein